MIYFVATRDLNEQALNGSSSYVIHFPADKLPESVINAFWSVFSSVCPIIVSFQIP